MSGRTARAARLETQPEVRPAPEKAPEVGPHLVWFVAASALLLALAVHFGLRETESVRGDLYKLLVFPHLFARFDLPVAKWFIGVMAVAGAASLKLKAEWFDRLAQWFVDHPREIAALSFVALAGSARFFYENYPLALDEFAQYFQSQIFAAGHIHGQYPPGFVRGLLPLAGQFIQFSPTSGETMSGYWPGLAVLLTPFTLLGIPWVTNPLLGAIGILLMRKVCLQLMPETPRAAGWAMLFLLASPAFFVNAISYYTMNVYLVFGLAYAVLVLERTPWRLISAGVIGSLTLVQHNPVPHVLFALPWIVWLFRQKAGWRNLILLGLGYLPLTLLLGLGWWWLKSKLALEYLASQPQQNVRSMEGAMKSLLSNGAFALPTADLLYARTIASLKLFLWAVPGLVIVCFWGARQLWSQPAARLWAWSALVTFVGYLFVSFDQGHGWGYRYFHGAFAALPLFAAAWVTHARDRVLWTRLMGALAVVSLVLLTPLRLLQVREFIREARSMAPAHDPDAHQVVFVYVNQGSGRYYAWDSIRNDPFLRNAAWVLNSRSPQADAELARQLSPDAHLISSSIHGTVWDLGTPTR